MDWLSPSEVHALRDFELNLGSYFEQTNQEMLEAELISQKEFLENFESKPLSLEQFKAVMMLDNRVMLVAAAGSGKTSVMVATAVASLAFTRNGGSGEKLNSRKS